MSGMRACWPLRRRHAFPSWFASYPLFLPWSTNLFCIYWLPTQSQWMSKFQVWHKHCIVWSAPVNNSWTLLLLPFEKSKYWGSTEYSFLPQNPILFIEHVFLHNLKGELPDNDFILALEKAELVREEKDIAIGASVHRSAQRREIDKGVDVHYTQFNDKTMLCLL